MGCIVDPAEAALELGLSSSITDEERAILAAAIVKASGAIARHIGYDPVYSQRTELLPTHYRAGMPDPRLDVSGGRAVLVDDRNYGGALQLSGVPVRSIVSVRIDYDAKNGSRTGAFGDDTAREEGTDFWANWDTFDSAGAKVCRDGLLWSSGAWPVSPGTVKVVYYAGWRPNELRGQDSVLDASPLWDACLTEVSRRVLKSFNLRKRSGRIGWTPGAIASESAGDYSVSYAGGTSTDRISGGTTDLLPETVHKLAEFVNWGMRMKGM